MKNEKAFTLIELLMSILLISIIIAVVSGSFISGNRISVMNEDAYDIQQNIRIAIQVISQELRMAGYDLAPTWNAMTIRTTNQIIGDNTRITFYYVADNNQIDADGDGNLDSGQAVRVTYALNGTTLERRSINATYDNATQSMTVSGAETINIIATNIEALQFLYFLGDGDTSGNWSSTPAPQAVPGTTNPTITRAVNISLVARSNRPNDNIPAMQATYRDPQTNTLFFTSPLDKFQRRLASTVVNLRNM